MTTIAQRRGVGEMSTPTQQPKHQNVIVRRREAGEISTPAKRPDRGKEGAGDVSIPDPQSKRRKVSVQHQADEKSTPAQGENCFTAKAYDEADETSEASVNVRCAVCKDIVARCKDRNRIFSWYHDIYGLLHSVAKGCHFCTQVLRDIPPGEVESLKREFAESGVGESNPVEARLKAETLYFEQKGVVFTIRRSNGGEYDRLASIDLYFSRDLGR